VRRPDGVSDSRRHLDADKRGSIPVLYYGDDTMDTYEIADRVDELITWVPDPEDLPPVTSLTEWE